MSTTNHQARTVRRLGQSKGFTLVAFASTTAALALVIWIKLRVVSSLPKQANAEPAATLTGGESTGSVDYRSAAVRPR